jgi:signal transduction histidine kinase
MTEPGSEGGIDQDENPISKQFYRLKLEHVSTISGKIRVLKITDITIKVRLEHTQQQKKVLQMVNACVSHEMRNPINSIIAMNIQLREEVNELKALLTQIIKRESTTMTQQLKKCISLAEDIHKHALV